MNKELKISRLVVAKKINLDKTLVFQLRITVRNNLSLFHYSNNFEIYSVDGRQKFDIQEIDYIFNKIIFKYKSEVYVVVLTFY